MVVHTSGGDEQLKWWSTEIGGDEDEPLLARARRRKRTQHTHPKQTAA